jgi:GntR family transcriptional regulator
MDQSSNPRRTRTIPLYRAIQQHVRDLINGPEFSPGDRVPSERVLAEQLGANRMTVRKAIDGLVSQGLLERNGTSGTRIAAPRVERPVDTHTSLGIARIVQSGGATPGNKLLHFEAAHATARVAERLGIPEGSELVVFRRLWTVNGAPFCIETSHIPAARVPGLAAEDLTAGQSLYALMRSRYGIRTVSGERMIGVAYCSEFEARLLGMSPGAACLLLRLLVFDDRNEPVEYVTSVNHPQLVVFKTAKAELKPGRTDQ